MIQNVKVIDRVQCRRRCGGAKQSIDERLVGPTRLFLGALKHGVCGRSACEFPENCGVGWLCNRTLTLGGVCGEHNFSCAISPWAACMQCAGAHDQQLRQEVGCVTRNVSGFCVQFPMPFPMAIVPRGPILSRIFFFQK
jgi:hypothetical protein